MITQTERHTSLRASSHVRLDPALRQHRVDIARWALSHGRPLSIDAITVIVAARYSEAVVERRPFTRWTSKSLFTFVFSTIDTWSRSHGVATPDEVGTSLFTYLDYLHAHGELSSGSSDIGLLRRTLAQLCRLTPAGNLRELDDEAAAVEPTSLTAARHRRSDATA